MLQALGKKPPQGKKEGKKERMPPLLLRAKSGEAADTGEEIAEGPGTAR